MRPYLLHRTEKLAKGSTIVTQYGPAHRSESQQHETSINLPFRQCSYSHPP